MADPVPAGSDVSAGTYRCTSCGYALQVGSTKNLPPCPSCHNGRYDTVRGATRRKIHIPTADRAIRRFISRARTRQAA